MTSALHSVAPRQTAHPRLPLHGLLRLVLLALGGVMATQLGGCAADRVMRGAPFNTVVQAELSPTEAQPAPIAAPAAPVAALVKAPAEPRIDLLINNAPARSVFLALVTDTRYSMLMHPDVTGTLSMTLRDVTVPEALDAIRDVYGYDYKIEGRRITIFAATMQSRVFSINYPNARRQGSSDVRVMSGGAQDNNNNGQNNNGNNNGQNNGYGNNGTNNGSSYNGNNNGQNNGSQQTDSAHVSTTSQTDLWSEMTAAVKGMIGTGGGRSVFTSPQAGLMVVRAMPDELQQVDRFLKAAKISVERQVMLEAKIVEVELRDGYQSGIDWSALGTSGRTTGGIGAIGGGTANALVNGTLPRLPGFTTASGGLLPGAAALPDALGNIFGLALASDKFQAVLGFLETRGDVQILSSPRIATLNNQKAVLKVGTDDYFVTNVTGGTIGSSSLINNSGTTTLPTLSLTSFFSGIALDVTPQVDETNNITLHVHPAVTAVTEKTKQIDLGTFGSYRVPLASSSVNESDTLVRIQDGNIVAIGGLMQVESTQQASGLPGTTDTQILSTVFGNRSRTGRKKEVIVLIKPTIIRSQLDWDAQTDRARVALDNIDGIARRVVRVDGGADVALPRAPARPESRNDPARDPANTTPLNLNLARTITPAK